MAKKGKSLPQLIYIGQNEYALKTPLKDHFDYVAYQSVEEFDEEQRFELFDSKTGHLNNKYRNSYYLIDTTTPWIDSPEVFTDLPANLMIISDDLEANVSEEIARILKLKGAFAFDLSDLDFLVHELKYYFFVGNEGLGLDFNAFVVSPNFGGKNHRVGKAYHELSGYFGDDWTFLGYNRQTIWIPQGLGDTFTVECEVLGDADMKVQLKLTDPNTGEVLSVQEASGDDLRYNVFNVEGGNTGFLSQINIFGKGNGTLRIGEIHLRRSRGPYGVLSLNGKSLVSKEGMNTSLEVYFDAGDLKPPLNVYFSGWRPKESFEGNFIMQRMGGPFLLISDNRLDGGSFYIGDDPFEQQLTDLIREKLEELHFTDKDLMFGGISMGTYSALYYGAKFSPYAIVVAKPLVNLGTIAENVRIKRPSDFFTSTDMILLEGGNLEADAIEKANQHFWKQFRKGKFDDTTFAIAYMLNDDYDLNAFKDIRKHLSEKNPTARILSKGLIGRHNDDTNGIVEWFLMQYNYLVRDGFDRDVGG